jgi:hypothetical protein
MTTSIATVTRLVDGLDVSATPHCPFPEGNILMAELIDIAAPTFKLLGAKITISDGKGGRTPVGLQELIAMLAPKNGAKNGAGGAMNWALAADALSSISVDDVIAALVGAVRRLFLEDRKRAERLFLELLSNSYAAVPAASGGMTRICLGTAEALRTVVGVSYRRLYALLAFALEVSFKDVFGGGWPGGLPGTSPA